MRGLDGKQKELIKEVGNFRMKDDKRTRVHVIVYQTLNRPTQTKCDGIKLMVEAVENIKPICKVEKVEVAVTIYDVPGIIGRDHNKP
ncbi:hypothetical protein IC582_025877 [Cucumis melo]